MQAITTIGLDIAKSVFQVHGINAEGNVIVLALSGDRPRKAAKFLMVRM